MYLFIWLGCTRETRSSHSYSASTAVHPALAAIAARAGFRGTALVLVQEPVLPVCHVIVALELTNDRLTSAGWKARSCLLKGDGTGSTARRQVTTGRNGFHCPSGSSHWTDSLLQGLSLVTNKITKAEERLFATTTVIMALQHLIWNWEKRSPFVERYWRSE